MCPASKNAVLMTAGHDELAGLGPDQLAALEAHDSTWVFPIPGSNRFAITSLCTLTQHGPVLQRYQTGRSSDTVACIRWWNRLNRSGFSRGHLC